MDTQPTSKADPRHRSFVLTRDQPARAVAAGDDPMNLARGWVRLVGSDGVQLSVRIDTITEIVGPYEQHGQWLVRLVCGETEREPIGFESDSEAEHFVEDLLFDE